MSHSSPSLHARAPARGRQQGSLRSKLSSVFNESLISILGNHKRRNQGQPRSRSQFQSSGRGGAGNIRSSSAPGGPANHSDLPKVLSKTRVRELRPPFIPGRVISTGRGGAGNFLSLSKNVVHLRSGDALSPSEAKQVEYEYWVTRVRDAANKAKPRSSGRGGAGNIVRSDHQSRGYAISIPPHPSHVGNKSSSTSSSHTIKRAPPSEESLRIAPWKAHWHSRTSSAHTIERAPPSEERLRIAPWEGHEYSSTPTARTMERAPPSEERLRVAPWEAEECSSTSSARTIERGPPSEERLRIAPWEAHWYSSQ